MNLPENMTSENVQKLFKVFGGAGYIRFVGGCVRNMILGLPAGDIDLATTYNPDQIIKILSKAKIKHVPTGLEHGTVTAVMDGIGYEITTLRRDVETDGRRAVVAFSKNWEEDAARRDFTMNALYADLDGQIYDPLGGGLNDLKKRRVRFVGDAEARIQEDYLRILRFFRFQSLYGKGVPDKKALLACSKFALKIKSLSRERVTQEFTKILVAESPQKILKVMGEYKILPDILDKNFNPNRIGLLIKFQNILGKIDKDVLFCLRLIIVLDFQFKKITKISNSLIINKKNISILNDISNIKINTKRIDYIKTMEFLYFFSSNTVLAAFILQSIKDELSLLEFKKLYDLFKVTSRPVLPISGKDLLLMGIPEGEKLGKLLKSLEKKWIQSGFSLTRKDLLKGIKPI